MNASTNRNDPCPCGSGKKFKKCCGLTTTSSQLSASEIQNKLGSNAARQGNITQALHHFEMAISLAPSVASYYHNKGQALQELKNFTEAEFSFKKAIKFNQNFIPSLLGLSTLYLLKGESNAAIELLERVISIEPNQQTALQNLGLAYSNLGQYTLGLQYLEKANQQSSNNSDLLTNIGILLEKCKRFDEAVNYFTDAIKHSHSITAYINLGLLFAIQGKLDFAITTFAEGIEFFPNSIHLRVLYIGNLQRVCAHTELQQQWSTIGHYAESENFSQHMQTINIDEVETLYSLLLPLNYGDTLQEDIIYKLHQRWAQLAKAQTTVEPYHFKQHDKIRVGFLSPDFRNHPVCFFIRNIFSHYNKQQFEFYCYSLSDKRDNMTEEISRCCHKFIDVTFRSNHEISTIIRNDEIDILIDIAGHTDGARTQIMAYRPSPIQIWYLGYPNTSGAEFIDYWISDSFAHSKDDSLHAEKLLLLPESFLCCGKFEDINRNSDTPAYNNDFFTFGSFNNTSKLSPTTIRIWSKVLHAIPNSRLLLKSKDTKLILTQSNIKTAFRIHNIDEERIFFADTDISRSDHLSAYNNIDIALDPIPYNGTTTTCEALWMGVPVLTLVGKMHRQRVSYSILKNIGVEDTIAYSEDEFVEIARYLANNISQLTELRHKVSTGIRNSILCNPQKFTHQFETQLLKAMK